MIKEGITILITILILGACVSICVADDYDIYTTFVANGTGDFDRTLDVQTELGFEGKSLDEDFYTKWMGTGHPSKWNFDSVLEVFMGNSTDREDEKISTIDYGQTAFSTNSDWKICSKNYGTGAMQSVTARGNMMESLELGIDDYVSEFTIEGAVNGQMRLKQKAVDPVTRITYLAEDTRLYGQYDIVWESSIEDLSYPAGEEDWLGCP
jgi:hypothetical protein